MGVKILRGDEQQIKRELVLKERKVYILKDKQLRIEIIQLYYNILIAGHREIIMLSTKDLVFKKQLYQS